MTRNHLKEQPVEMDSKKDLARVSKYLRKLTMSELLSLASSVKDKNWQPMDKLLATYLPKLKEKLELRDELRAQVNQLAEFNYAREPEFARQRTECLQLIKVCKSMGVGKKLIKVKSIVDKPLKALATSASELEDESEKLAAQFQAGELDYLSFQSRYIALRTQICHKRALADRLTKCLSLWSSVALKLAIDDDDDDEDNDNETGGDQYSVRIDSE